MCPAPTSPAEKSCLPESFVFKSGGIRSVEIVDIRPNVPITVVRRILPGNVDESEQCNVADLDRSPLV